GNLYVTGTSGGVETISDYATIKYDQDGHPLWVARYCAEMGGISKANAVAVDKEGYVYVTGYSQRTLQDADYLTIKYDRDGKEQWVARYGGPGPGWYEAQAIALDGDGNVYITGYSTAMGRGFEGTTVKYDSHGKEQWVARYGPGVASAIALDGEKNV